jgi:histidyl-tRNA synthetase
MATQQFDPPSGTRDFLADEVRTREHVFRVMSGMALSRFRPPRSSGWRS